MSNLIRCQNGHMFSSRRYGTICPYCNIETATREKKEVGQTETEDMGAVLLLGSGLHILKEISYDWCGSEKKRERVHGQRHPDNYRRQSLFLNLFHQKI